ncbi:response regulator transcription factor [Spongiactinospora sp. TRM90649]|uniref:response regulator n=1 Tax=Spongiactinospora sp. TRM90649 TaxID=3031114 RepID=UPI0023F77EF2|nr:response regulator transcription factor [Spongiactinospora sp. TRM90649]MDF5757974.1 response regulator transcription factor [Spongiactinospora sp. TRM90649]
MPRVLLADDQALFRDGLRMILGAHDGIAVVGEAADGEQAVGEALRLRPDLVVTDVRLPAPDGVEAVAEICRRTSARVLVLTMYDPDERVYDALRAGASGFLLKDARRDDLVRAVRLVHAGEALLAPSVTRRLIAAVAGRGAPGTARGSRLRRRLAELTEREVDALRLVARGLSNAEIAAELLLGEHTVKRRVNGLLAALGLRDRAQAVVFAHECGLVTAGPD